jgi:hypothetical protein
MFHAFELETGNCRVAQPGNSFDFADLQFAWSRFGALQVPKFISNSALQFAASGLPWMRYNCIAVEPTIPPGELHLASVRKIQIQFVGRAEVNI